MAKRIRLFAFVLFALLTIGTPAFGASPWQRLADPVFQRIDGSGLPEAAVMALGQDRAGFMWVGTQGGLARYDGYGFRSFMPKSSDPHALPDGYVRALLADPDGGMWIGSSSSGLAHFDAATETFRTWRPGAGAGNPRSAAINAVIAAPGGSLWIGGDGGLDAFDPQTERFTRANLGRASDQPVVWSLIGDRRGVVWAGTQRGVFYRPAGTTHFRPLRLRANATAVEPVVYSLYDDGRGHVWAGSVDALFRIDTGTEHVTTLATAAHDSASLAPGQQWTLIEVTPGTLWAGTDSALSIVDTATLRVHRVAPDAENAGGLSGGRVVAFFRGRSGAIWVANHVGGLLLYNPHVRGIAQLSATRPAIGFADKGAVGVAAASGGRLWAGGFFGHLARFDPRAAAPLTLTLPNHAAVQQLLAARDGTLWVATTNGLCALRPGAVQATCSIGVGPLTGASIYALVEDGKRVWVGGSAGLVSLDPASGAVTAVPRSGTTPLSNNQIRVLFVDRAHRLWAGSENGLNRIDPGGRVTRFVYTPGARDAIGPGGIATIMQDRRGRIWAGANGGPLEILSEDRDGSTHFRRLTTADGLPHDNVDGLAEAPDGAIWASTDKGIARIDPDTLGVRAFGLADGVTDGAYWAGAVTQGADGTIFFGGIDGITIVSPGATAPWTYAPPLVVPALAIGRRSISAGPLNRSEAKLELPAGARDLSVEFAALDFSGPQTLRYRYKLEGYDRDWIATDAAHREATYTQLPPGDYTLDVRGTNRLGVWSAKRLQIGVHALPAWYETWWLRALVALLIAATIVLVHRMRTDVLRRRQRELETIVHERTLELSEANAKLLDLSVSDPLTGLRNRRFLADRLAADVAGSLRRYEDRREDITMPLPFDADLLFFLIDLDHLKAVNDGFGHHAGDMVLVQMRDRLREVFRESDFLVRWGGDEFLAVGRGSKRDDAAIIAERICIAVASRPFSLGGAQMTRATVSVGFAAFPFVPDQAGRVSWQHVVDLADQALYAAKAGGRNRWTGFSATASTNADVVVHRLEHNAVDAVWAGAIAVSARTATVAE